MAEQERAAGLPSTDQKQAEEDVQMTEEQPADIQQKEVYHFYWKLTNNSASLNITGQSALSIQGQSVMPQNEKVLVGQC